MKLHIFLIMLMASQTSCSMINLTQECLCNQIYSEMECQRIDKCTWDNTQEMCVTKDDQQTPTKPKTPQTPSSPTPTPILAEQGFSSFCGQITSNEVCISTNVCAWENNACTHFTACTAFTTNCSSISNQCTSDGTHCIQKTTCSDYKTVKACNINKNGKYCFWNNKCEDITTCEKLPTILVTDMQCREQLSQCTTKFDGGCIESGINCSDQTSSVSCVTNKDGTQPCFWNAEKCLDRTCENAPLLFTDEDCREYLTTCTTKEGGGCVSRKQCTDATFEESCVTDISDNKCFWDGESCNIRICENAPSNLQTNLSCNDFLIGCITTGNGCVKNTGCEAAIVEQACDITSGQCHWDGSYCKLKTCENAGPNFVGDQACNNFVPNCTAKVGSVSGCMTISCLSAPLINNTNELCELYLPNHNCITKIGGGCKVNTTCEAIDIEIACVNDSNGESCFWYQGKCKTRTCNNAPSAYNTKQLCQDYSQYCTLGSNSSCVEKVCENLETTEECTFDGFKNPCVPSSGCKNKQCSYASKSITTHNDCQSFLSICTIDNSGSGCMQIPSQCSMITTIEGCKINQSLNKCGWNGSNCIDYTCTTAPNSLNNTSQCQQYKNGCVVNNTLNGCMDLPALCTDRQQKENCEVETGTSVKCQWNETDSNCMNIDCTNAHKVTLKGNVTQIGCWNYYSLNCIINQDGTQCISRPSSCDGLAQTACQQQNVLVNNSNCFWDSGSSTCKIVACSSISLASDYTHNNCFSQINTCTVNQDLNGCTDLIACDQYNVESQCVIDQNQYACQWVANACVYKNCSDAADSSNYSSDASCQAFSKNCTLTQSKCAIKRSTCIEYTTQEGCLQNTLSGSTICMWQDGACSDGAFDCLKVQGIGLTAGYCNLLNEICSVNKAGTQCIIDYGICQLYQQESACVWGRLDGNCQWTGSACQIDCSSAPGPYYDINYCQTYNLKCTAKLDATGCVTMQMSCESTSAANCTRSTMGYCYLSHDSCVTAFLNPLSNCSIISGVRLSNDYCQQISLNSCVSNAQFTSCVTQQYWCYQYDQSSCFQSLFGKCIYQGGCGSLTITSADFCGGIYIPGLSQYTDFHCYQYYYTACVAKQDKSGCTSASSITVSALPVCSSFTGTNLSFYYCVNKSKLCSVNAAKTACVDMKQHCSEYSTQECSYAFQDGECKVSSNQCIQNVCDNAPSTAIDTNGCQSYSSNCISRLGGCQTRSTCTSYTVSGACVKSLDGKDCLWNPSAGKCVVKGCINAENSTYFNDDTKCSTVGNCTVKANSNKTIGQGCIPRAACSTYIIQEQCKLNDKGIACIWNTNNPQSPVCSDKSCSTAVLAFTTHSDCQQYLNGCTVNIVNSIPQGCTTLKPCNQYLAEDQCKISSELDSNNNSIICDWNGKICGNKNCLTANNTYNTPTKCQQYFQNCTVNSTNDGCTNIPSTCEGMTQEQCFIGSLDASSRECWWKNNQCITKTCLNSPKSDNEDDCESHLSTCTLAYFLCKTLSCSNFELSTEPDCLAAVPSGICTSNGSVCVAKVDCSDSQTQIGCTNDNKGRKCEWVTNDDGSSQCSLQSCMTAPITIKTEEECHSYYTPTDGNTCTTKLNGGCIVKGDCTTLTIQSICTTDNKGLKCVWDIDTQLCRYPTCKDISGTSYAQCNSIDSKCTVGVKGKCATFVRCEDIKIKDTCILGTNGPCLWVAKYQNSDNSFGACFSYSSCQSFSWTSDAQCKLISPHCTTDGQKCVGMNICSELSPYGCIKGTDGVCVLTPITKDSKDLVCKLFTNCNDAYYLTHDECMKANSNCTSDYLNGCVSLSICSKYTIEGQCQLDNLGIIKDDEGKAISTGKCVWNETDNKCRDEECTDLLLTTELECQSKLYACTSDGQNCLMKGECTSYITQNACEIAGGTDGPCFWVEAKDSIAAFCRLKLCSDIKNGTTAIKCSEITDCISDGINCLNKAQCSSYITKLACQSTGKDGVCIWLNGANSGVGKCQRMTSCSDSQEELSCTQASNRCIWISLKNQCTNHTCETYQSQENKCTFFYSFDMKKYNICALNNNGKCIDTDPSSFNEQNCYEMSGKLYSWNPLFKQCSQCERILMNDINESNNTAANSILKKFLLALLILLVIQ